MMIAWIQCDFQGDSVRSYNMIIRLACIERKQNQSDTRDQRHDERINEQQRQIHALEAQIRKLLNSSKMAAEDPKN